MSSHESGLALSSANKIATASLALLGEYGEFMNSFKVYESTLAAGKPVTALRELGPITEDELADAQDPDYVASEIATNELVQQYANMTVDDYRDRFELRLGLVRSLFGTMVTAVMDAIPAGTTVSASSENVATPEQFITISPETGLEKFSRVDPNYPTPRSVYNPRTDQQQQLGALDITVLVPDVCAAAQQVIVGLC